MSNEVNPPTPLDAMQVASLFTAHTPDLDTHEQTLRQIAADVQWLRAEMARVMLSLATLAESVECLVDAIAELEPEEQDDPALTLDGEQAGSPRDQGAPL